MRDYDAMMDNTNVATTTMIARDDAPSRFNCGRVFSLFNFATSHRPLPVRYSAFIRVTQSEIFATTASLK
jgi:hypothetical protein